MTHRAGAVCGSYFVVGEEAIHKHGRPVPVKVMLGYLLVTLHTECLYCVSQLMCLQ